MTRHFYVRVLLPLGLVGMVLGCGQAPKPATVVPASAPATNGVRLHWVGKTHVLGDTNTTLSQIWRSAESLRLESEVTVKLGRHWAAAAGLPTNAAAVNTLASFCRDALAHETWLELGHSTNQDPPLTVAVRLDDARARQWETEWRQFGAAASDSAPAWIQKQDAKETWALARVQGWTVLLRRAAGEELPASDAALAQLRRPFPEMAQTATNAWLQLTVAPEWQSPMRVRLGEAGQVPSAVTLVMVPEGTDVRLRGVAELGRPVPLVLPAWDVPTNLIRGPLSSFTAVRGVSNSLAALPVWRALKAGAPPDQFAAWSVTSALVESHLAFPDAQADRRVQAISSTLIERGDDWFGASGMGGFRAGPEGTGAVWTGLPFITPTVQVATNSAATFVLGSLAPVREDTNDFPSALHDYLQEHPRLVYYDWQLTGPQVQAGILASQLTRLLFQRSQLPDDSASLRWLQSLVPALGNSVTVVEAGSDQAWTFSRRSGVGFTALELHLLADWFAAPGFPGKLRFQESFEPPPPTVPPQ